MPEGRGKKNHQSLLTRPGCLYMNPPLSLACERYLTLSKFRILNHPPTLQTKHLLFRTTPVTQLLESSLIEILDGHGLVQANRQDARHMD